MGTRKSFTRLGILLAALAGILALALPSMAAARDRNHDNLPDRWERNHNLSLQVNHQARKDQDSDGLVNHQEFRDNTDPRDEDTDGDGIDDENEGGGTIASFDGTTLVIDSFSGDALSGTVDANTEVSCEARDENGDGDSFDDDQGEDNDNQGDDDDQGTDRALASAADDDQGDDDQGEDEDDDADQVPCTTADLTPRTVVHEAEVEGGVFTGIELVK